MLDINEVMKRLPHRYPFLLIDRVLEYQEAKSLKAIKNVSITDPWFIGHFPESPVMPGVLMVEAMAQAAGILAYLSLGEYPDGKSLFYLAGVDDVRFKQIVQPGDQLHLHIEFIKRKGSIWKVAGEALVDDKVVASANITSAHKELS